MMKTTRLSANYILPLVLVFGLSIVGCTNPQERERSALHHFKKGNEAYGAEDYTRAIRHFENAVELDHQSPDLHYNLGLAFYVTGNYNAAVLSFQDALQLNPAMQDAHYNLALAYDKLYNSAAAHMHYNAYRNMIAGKNLQSVATSGTVAKRTPLPPPPNVAAGIGPNAGKTRSAAVRPSGMQQAAGKGGNGQIRPKASPAEGIHRNGGARQAAKPRGSTTSGMPKGVRQQLPMRQSAQPNHAVNTSAPGQQMTKQQNSTTGGNQKWWIQDRFTQTW